MKAHVSFKKPIKMSFFSLYITCVENLAAGKTTNQSSTWDRGVSGKAVDGKFDTDVDLGFQCAHTEQDPIPSWWWVDLGSDNVPVSEVLLVNRFSLLEVIRQRNKDFVITLGQHSFCCCCCCFLHRIIMH